MPQKILLVDDEKDIRTMLRMTLELADYEVDEAADGLTALGKLQVFPFDAVLLDLSMPRLDGESALETISRLPSGKKIPVIVVTAQDDDATRQRVNEAGAAGLLIKPINTNILIDLLRRVLP